MALQNVKSYGTEGREKTQEGVTFVPPQQTVHPYLLFRGCDIKDLHVHENQEAKKETKEAPRKKEEAKQEEPKKSSEAKKSNKQPRPRQSNNKSKAQVGTGASLLNRKERGTVDGGTLLLFRSL